MKTFFYILAFVFVIIDIASFVGVLLGHTHQLVICVFTATMAFFLFDDAKTIEL
jgi:UPF0716 family protein affecting phage T7 exclusion